jgi:hypothetical protein
MTITSAQLSVTWLGNGLTQTFTYPFLIPSPGQCQLVFTDATGKATVVAPGLFSISNTGNSTGGTLTYPLTGGPIAAGTSLTLTRVVPYQQAYHPAVQGPIYNPTLENALDSLAMQIMQAASHLGEFTINGKVVTSAAFTGALSVSIVNGVATVNVQTTPGPTGAQGPQGEQGETGATGAAGARGSLWFDGAGAPGVIAGALPDDQYLDTAAGDVYLLGAGGVWAKTGNIRGLQGQQGVQGPQGIPGTGSSVLINNGSTVLGAATTIEADGTTLLATLNPDTGTATLSVSGETEGSFTNTEFRYLGMLLYCNFGTALANNIALSEVSIAASPGGPNQCVGGTAGLFGTPVASFPASNAFDGNPATFWFAPSGAIVVNLYYDLGVGKSGKIVEITITPRQDGDFNQAPLFVVPMGSNDLKNWKSASLITPTVWTAANQTFEVQDP